MARRTALTAAYRWQVASRVAAAMLGSFAFASAFGILLAALLMRSGAMVRPAAVQTATLAAFLVWCGAVMWAFQTRSHTRVWLQQMAPALAMGVLAWWLLRTGAP
jgi:membrane protein CcdC involved in cytochrome C biogenesis